MDTEEDTVELEIENDEQRLMMIEQIDYWQHARRYKYSPYFASIFAAQKMREKYGKVFVM